MSEIFSSGTIKLQHNKQKYRTVLYFLCWYRTVPLYLYLHLYLWYILCWHTSHTHIFISVIRPLLTYISDTSSVDIYLWNIPCWTIFSNILSAILFPVRSFLSGFVSTFLSKVLLTILFYLFPIVLEIIFPNHTFVKRKIFWVFFIDRTGIYTKSPHF